MKVPIVVNLKVSLAVNIASKLQGDPGSKLEGALVLDTRCHCMNISSENMKSFLVWPLDVLSQGGKPECDYDSTLEGDSGSGNKLAGDSSSGSKLVGDSSSGSKLAGDSGSKLEGAQVLDTRCHYMSTSSENMNSFWVWPLDVICQGEGVNLKVSMTVNLKVTLGGNL